MKVVAPAQRAGIEAARAGDRRDLGRKPSSSRAQSAVLRDLLAKGSTITAVARAIGLTRQTVYRIEGGPGRGRGDAGELGGQTAGRARLR